MRNSDAVAVIGMGCQFGGAADLNATWSMHRQGRHGFRKIPTQRFDADRFLDSQRRATDKIYTAIGAFIDDVYSFPGIAFGIPPRRLDVTDPQQRWMLEVSLQAIEDSGRHPSSLPQQTGVFIGVTGHEFRTIASARIIAQLATSGIFGHVEDPIALMRAVERIAPSRPYSASGVLANMTSAIVAQELDLRGPAYTIDAACASSLIAIVNAVEQLRTRKIDAAIAGGVYLCFTPEHYIAFGRIGAMSPTGACRPFDVSADGFLQGDGVGAVLLKRLEDAHRDGDRIYAVIRGVASNNDGRGDGPMAPSERGQRAVITAAWKDSGVDPNQLGYLEAHGTATDVGDIVEFNALKNTFGDSIEKVALGSAKANLGHTQSAAGVAGFIRAALAIHHQEIPPLAGFEAPRPELELNASHFYVPKQAIPWNHRLAAGVSSFGFGGTNAHVVLTAPESVSPKPIEVRQPELLLISAGNETDLRKYAARLSDAIADNRQMTVASVARTLASRPVQPARLAIVARDRQELISRLTAFAQQETTSEMRWNLVGETPKIAFLFPGQGSQRVGLLADARKRFAELDAAFKHLEQAAEPELQTGLLELIDASVDDQAARLRLMATEYQQPVMFAAGFSLAKLLQQVGIQPNVVTGHSLGEFVAAAVAGVFSAADAIRFVARRGRAMADLPGDHGTMIAVMTDSATVSNWLVEGAVLANFNHPRQVVVSGTPTAIAQVKAIAEVAGVQVVPLEVSHAFHSPLMSDLVPQAWLEGISLHDPLLPVASGIQTFPYRNAENAREVFHNHAISPIHFVDALRQCTELGANLFIQVGAGGPLAAFARGSLPPGTRIVTLASRDDHDGGASILKTLAALWCEGVSLDPRPLTAPAPLVTLPPTVRPREIYWIVKDEAQPLPKIAGQTISSTPSLEKIETQELEAPVSTNDPVIEAMFALISRVSAYPKAAIRLEQRLQEDLGFDSIMLGDLATGFADAFPNVGGIPQELLVNQPTVQTLVHFARGSSASEIEVEDHQPLSTFLPEWQPYPLIPGTPFNEALTIVGDPELAFASNSPGKAIVLGAMGWTAAFEQLASIHHQQPRPPVIFSVSNDVIGSWGALAACLVREWGTLVKAIGFDTPDSAFRLERIREELGSEDRTPIVRYRNQIREIQGLQQISLPKTRTIGSGDIAVITGGTKGIGAKLALQLIERGVQVTVIGRGEPDEIGREVIAQGAAWLSADVSDPSLVERLKPLRANIAIHAAGIQADGAIHQISPEARKAAWATKVLGWRHLRAATPEAKVRLALGSWAARFGNRHQTAYAVANADLAKEILATHTTEDILAEFGPWAGIGMAERLPIAVRQALRTDGVEFVGWQAGIDALMNDLEGASGVVVHGRHLPAALFERQFERVLDVNTHPFLLDHAIEGTPVFPLACAADAVVAARNIQAPFEVVDLCLFQGVVVRGPTPIHIHVRGDRVDIRGGERGTLAYRARVLQGHSPVQFELPTDPGKPPELDLATFYRDITFHGPLLQGIVRIDSIGADFIRGRVRSGSIQTWIPGASRQWSIDPLALDSAFQLCGYAAWVIYQRAGTPIGIRRFVQLSPWVPGEFDVVVRFGEANGDRFTATLAFYTANGELLALAEDVVAELKPVEDRKPQAFYAEHTDPGQWPEVRELEMRLEAATALGIRNPYFAIHDGTARDTTTVNGRELVNFSSYNYLGLSGDPDILTAVEKAIHRYGTSVSASRVASGERPFHIELERELAEAQDVEDTLVFTAGHATNVTTIGHLFGPKDLILHDELIHDSILQGIKLSGAARRAFHHDDPEHLAFQLKQLRRHHEKVLIVVEGVYSMDGDICRLPEYIALKQQYGTLLMIDEAHSFGVIGPTGCGAREHFQIPGREVDLWMGTLSKSLASCGGWIGGSKRLINYLRYTAPGFVYSAGLTPANGQAALSALRKMRAEPWRVRQLQKNAKLFQSTLADHGIDTGPARGGSAVVPAITGNSMHALLLSQRLVDLGINVQPIVYPAVADNAARLRFFLSSTHQTEQLIWAASQVATSLTTIRTEYPSSTG